MQFKGSVKINRNQETRPGFRVKMFVCRCVTVGHASSRLVSLCSADWLHTGGTVVEDGDGRPPVVTDDVDGKAVEVGGSRSHRQQVVRPEVLRRRVVDSEVRNTELLRRRQYRLHVRSDYRRHVRRTDLHVRWLTGHMFNSTKIPRTAVFQACLTL